MKRTRRTWLGRRLIATILVVPMLLWLSGCWLYNTPPVAAFTASTLSGYVPLTVDFSGVLSEDEDGTIVRYEWSFDDGRSGAGPSVSHTYTAAGTYTVVLRVTDDRDETATTQKTVYVHPAEPEGPVASFAASSTSGTSPLTVQFDASASRYEGGVLTSYEWDFGDGRIGYGLSPRHTYYSGANRTYTVALTVTGSDGSIGTTTGSISVTVSGGGATSTAPSARFDIIDGDSVGVAPLHVRFDPSDSEADAGRTLALFVWGFGDGDAASDVSATVQEHVYTTDDASEVFSVTLIVLDNESEDDSITKTVKAYNHQPVAGFEIANPPGGDGAGVVEFASAAAAIAAATWEADDVTYGNLGALTDVNVVVRSMRISDDRWRELTATADQADLRTATTSAVSSTKPLKPDDYDDHNYSYDPEGQEWVGLIPAWFRNRSWGIEYLEIDWDDGGTPQRVDYNETPALHNGDTVIAHTYAFDGNATSKTITVTAFDYLGAESSFSRTVFLKAGIEAAEEL